MLHAEKITLLDGDTLNEQIGIFLTTLQTILEKGKESTNNSITIALENQQVWGRNHFSVTKSHDSSIIWSKISAQIYSPV